MRYGFSEEATNKAFKVLMGNSYGEAVIFTMLINKNMTLPNADYELLKSVMVHSLKQDGSMSDAEIDKVDFDEIIKPFVDEIDFDDDYHIRQVKREVMSVIRSHH